MQVSQQAQKFQAYSFKNGAAHQRIFADQKYKALLQAFTTLTAYQFQEEEFVQQVLSYIEVYTASSFNGFKSMEKMLIYISDIRFPKLIVLYLGDSNISSLQAISRIDLPQLQKLQIGNNKIRSLQSLRKASLPQLNQLQLRSNYLDGNAWLQEMDLVKLQYLGLQIYRQAAESFKNISWLLKLDAIGFSQVWAISKTRIPQLSVLKTLKNKYFGINIRAHHLKE